MSHEGSQNLNESSSANEVDVGTEQVAQVYAKAIVEAAETAGCRNDVVSQLNTLARDVLPKIPQAADVFASPKITTDVKDEIIDRLAKGRLQPTTTHSLHVLARHGRLGILAAVAKAASRLADERDGIHEAFFTTAIPLTDEKKNEVLKDVQQSLGMSLKPSFIVDASIIGGLIVQVGDTIYDQSVATSLTRLGNQLRQRNISALQTGEYSWQT